MARSGYVISPASICTMNTVLCFKLNKYGIPWFLKRFGKYSRNDKCGWKTGFSVEIKEDIQYEAEPKTKGMEEKEVAEEEGILSKVKGIFKPETAAEEKE